MPTVFITGAGRGIGLEFARQYAADGWTVFATVRSKQAAEKLAGKLEAAPGDFRVLTGDVCHENDRQAWAQALAGQPLHLLINNAGILGDTPQSLGNTDTDSWEQAFAVNAIAPVKMVEALLPSLEKADEARIIGMSSRIGSTGASRSSNMLIYGSTKAALNYLSKQMAETLTSKKIYTAVLHPGWVQTDMGGANAEMTPEQSVSAMRKVITELDETKSGGFYTYDGTSLPW